VRAEQEDMNRTVCKSLAEGEMESRHRGMCQDSRGNTSCGMGDIAQVSVVHMDPGNCELT